MKKPLTLSLLVCGLLLIFFISFVNYKKQVDEILKSSYKINEIIFINQFIDRFLNQNITFNNFDKINENILKLDEKFKEVLNKENFPTFNQSIYQKEFIDLYGLVKKQKTFLENIKTGISSLGNSYSFMYNLSHGDLDLDKYKVIKDIFTLSSGTQSVNIETILKKVEKIKVLDNQDKLFVSHALLIIKQSEDFYKLKSSIEDLQINSHLKRFNDNYLENVKDIREKNKYILFALYIVLTATLVFLFYYYYKSVKIREEIGRFKSAVENSDNIIVVTDYDQKIKYVNESFTKSTGYTLNDVIGKTPSILKSGYLKEDFYKDLNKTIYSGKKWFGEFINIDKNGRKRYEKASITPILNSKGKIDSFLSIKLDITDEVEAKEKLDQNNKLIEKQAKMAALGEMLENIAHQWRQPLSVISTVASGMHVKKIHGILKDDDFYEHIGQIEKSCEYLSNTIEDFRNFYKSDKQLILFDVEDIIKRTQNIVSAKLKNKFIGLQSDLFSCKIKGIEGEMVQILLNLYSNAVDAFEKADSSNNIIFTKMEKNDENLYISVTDTAGGIKEDIINKVFEPYFTTKHKSQGTGIGLFMSYKIATETFGGNLKVENDSFIYNGKSYTGARFTIIIPLV